MFYVIWGMGIIIGQYLAAIISSLITLCIPGITGGETIQIDFYSKASYIPAFMIAFYIVRTTSLKSKLPNEIKGFFPLIGGVWLSFIWIILDLIITFIPYIGRWGFALWSISGILILVGLFNVLLAANPNKK